MSALPKDLLLEMKEMGMLEILEENDCDTLQRLHKGPLSFPVHSSWESRHLCWDTRPRKQRRYNHVCSHCSKDENRIKGIRQCSRVVVDIVDDLEERPHDIGYLSRCRIAVECVASNTTD